MDADLAVETGIFDFANATFMSSLPDIGPHKISAKGRVTC